ncbi:MAG: hypothetical protein NTW95_02870 [Candidatus Aminicenantes bacterium]|nr:hypothetical protein [Candidatus Aminicenantes bacterium]
MIKSHKKMIAVCVTLTFLFLLPIHSQPMPAGQALSQNDESAGSSETSPNYYEKELQTGIQISSRNVLPIVLGIAAVAAGIFLLVYLVSKIKYDITGVWDFHNDYTTEGYTDFDSVWTFTAWDERDKAMGVYVRNENGKTTQGQYTVVNKKEVVFQDDWMTEQYVGQFDSKTTMSGTFMLADGAQGVWTATKR